jgi:hypothetical protein
MHIGHMCAKRQAFRGFAEIAKLLFRKAVEKQRLGWLIKLYNIEMGLRHF